MDLSGDSLLLRSLVATLTFLRTISSMIIVSDGGGAWLARLLLFGVPTDAGARGKDPDWSESTALSTGGHVDTAAVFILHVPFF